jgi:UDP-N-acetyl-2-amino-2-deoxyglucuronate dehydrogenase
LNVGLIGTAAVAHKHAQAYRNLGFELVVCSNRNEERGRRFAEQYEAEFVRNYEQVCEDPRIDYVDICTFPAFRLEPLHLSAKARKHVLVQKPIATSLDVARQMIQAAESAGVTLGVVSQHRFDESSRFLIKALREQRLGRILQCDCYLKWFRSQDYYGRPEKGSWKTEGGGVLINQAIHSIDLIRSFAGPVKSVFGMWQIAAAHKMESEDLVSALLQYESGATGVIQASTAVRPGYPERIEIHGTKGSAIITGDRLSAWDVQDDGGEQPQLQTEVQSGASDPLAISLESFELQFQDFADAIREGRQPLVSGRAAFDALAIVEAIYESCRSGQPVAVEQL